MKVDDELVNVLHLDSGEVFQHLRLELVQPEGGVLAMKTPLLENILKIIELGPSVILGDLVGTNPLGMYAVASIGLALFKRTMTAAVLVVEDKVLRADVAAELILLVSTNVDETLRLVEPIGAHDISPVAVTAKSI